jgi:heptosyltransferase-2
VKRLVIAPNWVGDAVMSVPLLRALKKSEPAGRLATLCRPSVAPILAMSGAVDEVWKSSGRNLAGFWRDALRARKAKIDEIWVLPHSFRSALLARAMGSPRRIGYAADHRAALLTAAIPRPPATGHQLRDEDRLLESAGIAPDSEPPRLVISRDLAAASRRELETSGMTAEIRPIFLAPGAAFGPTKLWPAERYALLADALLDRGERVALVIGPDEIDLGRLIARRARHRLPILGADLDTGRLAALLAEGRLLIGNDSGPAHLAAAVAVPSVVFFGPTDPGRTTPQGAPSLALDRYVFCSPCYLKKCRYQHECMEEITVEMALDAALRMLG